MDLMDCLAIADENLHWANTDADLGGKQPDMWSLMVPRVELALKVADAHMRMAEILLAMRKRKSALDASTSDGGPQS